MERLFDHVDLRVRHLGEADAFYGQLLPLLGFPHRSSGGGWICYDAADEHPKTRFIALIEDPQHQPNATRLAFWRERRQEVEALGAVLRRIGARNLEGPELCPEYSADYYAAFFEDPCGNRLEVCCRIAEPASPRDARDEEALWALERRFWLEGAQVYRDHLDPAAVLVFAEVGVLRASEIPAAVERAPRWKTVTLLQPTSTRSGTCVILAYQAEARRDEGPTYRAWCTSTYRWDGTSARLLQHQQTPLQP